MEEQSISTKLDVGRAVANAPKVNRRKILGRAAATGMCAAAVAIGQTGKAAAQGIAQGFEVEHVGGELFAQLVGRRPADVLGEVGRHDGQGLMGERDPHEPDGERNQRTFEAV